MLSDVAAQFLGWLHAGIFSEIAAVMLGWLGMFSSIAAQILIMCIVLVGLCFMTAAFPECSILLLFFFTVQFFNI